MRLYADSWLVNQFEVRTVDGNPVCLAHSAQRAHQIADEHNMRVARRESNLRAAQIEQDKLDTAAAEIRGLA